VAGALFPFCFITIACGAISGFHTLIASGTTPKLITREGYARPIGYGAMCLESLVAIMALIAACTLDPGVYLAMNVKGEAAATAAKVSALNFPVTVEQMDQLATDVGEKTLFGRTGGAATLAVGMAQIFSKVTYGKWLDLWYHFAIMFEALFILTTLDAGTRVGRYILQDALGSIWKPLGNTKNLGANVLASALMVAGWGWFLIQGVRNPLGGIYTLWPLFGIANQMLAAIALCLATTIILKMQLGRAGVATAQTQEAGRQHPGRPSKGRPALALVMFVPLAWLLSVTFTAGIQKVWHSDPRIGFLAQAQVQSRNFDLAHAAANTRDKAAQEKAAEDMKTAKQLRANNLLDAGVAITFLTLTSVIVLTSMREWLLLLTRRKPAKLHEGEPVWLPEYAVKEPGANLPGASGAAVIALGLAKELSGEAQLERARQQACTCTTNAKQSPEQIYVATTEQRFNGIRRCC
jgi:carbon starvation protein